MLHDQHMRSEADIRAMIASVPFWFHQIEVAPDIVTPGVDRSAEKLARLNLPADLTGKRVLDIGAWDGFFSFECERRGAAEVIATDAAPSLSFAIARALLGSRVQFHTANIYDLTPERFGEFDLVLCLGVLYHLRHPLLGLERVHAVCRGELIVETLICDQHFVDASGAPCQLADIAPALLPVPIARFYPKDEFNNDGSNWWAPNLAGLHAMLSSSGFMPQRTTSAGDRACVHCRRVEPPRLYEWADTLKFDSLPPDHPAARLLEQAGALEARAAASGDSLDQQRTYSRPRSFPEPDSAQIAPQSINQYNRRIRKKCCRACWPRRSRRRAGRCYTRSRSLPRAGHRSPTWRRRRIGWRGSRATRAGRWRPSRTGACCASCAG